VLDPSLFGAVDVTKGAPEDAIILVNSEMTPQQLREQYKIEGRKLYTIAANRIAQETIHRAIPNTPMIGALIRITGLFPIDDVVELLREEFTKKFAPKVVEGNLAALTRSYEEVQGE
jgi:pyruvate ferredoxin oxidoreductase gamma subunit